MANTTDIAPYRAYYMGRHAAYRGFDNCPFPIGSRAAKNWFDGWRDYKSDDWLDRDEEWDQ